jgi:hypothetical protein
MSATVCGSGAVAAGAAEAAGAAVFVPVAAGVCPVPGAPASLHALSDNTQSAATTQTLERVKERLRPCLAEELFLIRSIDIRVIW